MSAPDQQTLRMTRVFGAPQQEVFDAWTDVETLRLWWPAGPGWQTPTAEVDVRVGGRLRLVMRDPEGNVFGGEGTYLTLDRPRRLAFSWQWDIAALGTGRQLVDVRFTGNADGTTTVILTNTGLTGAEQESHREGWDASFDNLDEVLRKVQR
jgi:uncharacterized protein YndB with AHSA1/START domain